MIEVDVLVQHANEMNRACESYRDFTLTNRSHATGAITSHGRMLYSRHVTFTFDVHGGFWARHVAGIFEYAYPTSDCAKEARKTPMETAKLMLQGVWDCFEHYQSLDWFAGSMNERAEKMAVALARKPTGEVRLIKHTHTSVLREAKGNPMKAQEQAIRIAADSVEQLRKIDVYRVLDSCPRVSSHTPKGTSKEVALYIIRRRPDLRQEVLGCMSELGCELRVPVEHMMTCSG